VWQKTNGLCHLCEQPVELGVMTFDHIMPKSHGGKFSFENLLPAHQRCNTERGNKGITTPEKYLKVKQRIKANRLNDNTYKNQYE